MSLMENYERQCSCVLSFGVTGLVFPNAFNLPAHLYKAPSILINKLPFMLTFPSMLRTQAASHVARNAHLLCVRAPFYRSASTCVLK